MSAIPHPRLTPGTLLAESLLLLFWLTDSIRFRLWFEWSMCGRIGLVPHNRGCSQFLSDRGRQPPPAVRWHPSFPVPAEHGPGLPLYTR
ncbi:MAG: hypothetical protein FD161_3941 [Limisphaerales bacterium]|nr:MAG: hypothetical protein FD161_3941 [Limisphaerales bacterium]TXT45673.1 MAG: hypothetical protein FD140_4640 [Limisphaerales bacterium]